MLPFAVGAPIPDILFTPLETALRTKIRALAKEIASTLGQAEDPLIQALLKGATVKPYIAPEPDDKENDYRCTAQCTHPDSPAILERCGEPVFWVSSAGRLQRCAAHLTAGSPLQKGQRIQQLRRLDVEDEHLSRSEDGTVFQGDGTPVGYLTGSRLVRLKVKEESS